MNLEREHKIRNISNWLAVMTSICQYHYSKPNYKELLKRLHELEKSLAALKRDVIYLINTRDE